MAFQITVKAIKAKALNVKKVQQEIQKALEEEGKVLQREFAKTTEAWEGIKPAFSVTTGGTSNRAWVHCYPSGSKDEIDKWVRLDEGSPPHVIAARNAPALVFPFRGKGQSYDPGTVRYWLGSMGHRKLGPISRFKAVHHPGHEPRDWSIVLGEKELEPFAERIQAAVDRGLEG